MRFKIYLFSLLSLILTSAFFSNTAFAAFSATSVDGKVFNFSLMQGHKGRGEIIVSNLDDSPLLISLYGADSTQSAQGSFAILTIEQEQKMVGKWITFDQSEITLLGKEKKTIGFSIKVPKDAIPGSYMGGIAVATLAASADKSAGASMSIVSRISMPLYVEIPGEKIYKYSWNKHDIIYDSAKKLYKILLGFQNDGNTIISINSKISIYGYPDGLSENNLAQDNTIQNQFVKKNEAEYEEKKSKADENIIELNTIPLAPGDSIEVPVYLNKKPLLGIYTVKTLTSFSEFDIINNKDINTQTVSKETTFYIIPWGGVAIIIFIILSFGLFFIFRILKLKKAVKNGDLHTIEDGETLQTLAGKYGIKWQLIAKINHIKAPYIIEKGQQLIIPKK